MRFALLIMIAACAGGSGPAPTPSGPPASLESTKADAADVIVAQVNGHPVWGSCVAAQARRGSPRDAALHECIDFELMAQSAAERGLATDRDVVVATRTALVSELVAEVYEAGFTQPADFGDAWNKILERNKRLIQHPEYRGSTYVRAPFPDPKVRPPTPAEDTAAQATAERVAAALARETGLMPGSFVALAEKAAGDASLQHQDVTPRLAIGLYKSYADALWAIPEIGRTSPAVRTLWGWDVVLFTELVPAVAPNPGDLVGQVLPDVKRAYFNTWVTKLAQSLGIRVEMFKDNIERLDSVGP